MRQHTKAFLTRYNLGMACSSASQHIPAIEQFNAVILGQNPVANHVVVLGHGELPKPDSNWWGFTKLFYDCGHIVSP